MIEELCLLRKKIKKTNPLIHCLTNHITSNDCANAVLAVGAKPIMAEHPAEVEQITLSADALAINLGNISDSRMQAMLLSGRKAWEHKISCIIDLVGIGCSELRLNFARKFIAECRPAVIKGNVSEIRALLESKSSRGVDVSQLDRQLELKEITVLAKKTARQYSCLVLVSGKVDVVADGDKVYFIDNGHPLLASVTGTGCVLNVLCATFMSSGEVLRGVLLACLLLCLAGELAAQEAPGPGTFRVQLFDSLYNLSDAALVQRAKITEVNNEEF